MQVKHEIEDPAKDSVGVTDLVADPASSEIPKKVKKSRKGQMQIPTVRLPVTPERKKIFLKTLARTGIFAQAARAASPHGAPGYENGCLQSFYQLRKKDPVFALQCAEALEHARAVIEEEIHRRAIDGVLKPVFQGGELVGHVREYSDTLLIAKAKAKLPEYRDRQQVEHAGILAVAGLDGIANLSRAARDAIRRVVEIEAEEPIGDSAGDDLPDPDADTPYVDTPYVSTPDMKVSPILNDRQRRRLIVQADSRAESRAEGDV